MKTYSSNNYNQTGAFYRLVDAMKRAKKSHRRFTIFIGAGCSLTSSSRDIGIEQVILDSLCQGFNPNYKHPGNWEQLYKDFVNYVWAPRNKSDRMELLNDAFLNLKPNAGYKNLRLLIENGYVTDIITTNFDMLIDDSLAGLSYNVQVGTNPIRSVKGGSPIFLFKIHGDIENGELRFSPSELEDLPDTISNIIKNITDHSCLVCGYRGQDVGVMKSLCRNSSYSVFWADPKKPIKNDIYESKKIYTWMEARKSDSNFIFGALGKFDELMIQLVTELLSVRPFKTEHIIWQNSSIVNALRINNKVYHIFNDILFCSDAIFEEYEWHENTPFYADDYKKILKAFLHYYQHSEKRKVSFFKYPENEIEALLLGVSLDIIARVEGIPISKKEYLDKLKRKFIESATDYRPDEYFWTALYKILNIQYLDAFENDIPYIQLSLNENGHLMFSMFEPNIDYLSNIVSTLYICALFLPTCDNSNATNTLKKNKILLQSVGEYYDIQQDTIIFQLGALTSNEFEEIYTLFFKERNFIYDKRNQIIGANIKILADINGYNNISPSKNLYEYIVNASKYYTHQFTNSNSAYGYFDKKYVHTILSGEIDNFLKSNKKCMFLIGASGSGKTTAIKHFVNTYSNKKQLIYVLSPKFVDNDNCYGLQEFFPDLFQPQNTADDIVINISQILKVRNFSLVLIYEGLNEINNGFISGCLHYRGLWETTELLYKNNITNIKLIVTCRDQIFNEYCNETSLYLEPESCYCSSINNDIIPYYKIPNLSIDYQKKLARAHFADEKKLGSFLNELNNNPYVQNTFSQPYLIALASKFWDENNTSVSFSLYNIFSCFTKQMIKSINNKSNISLAYEIINKYFEILLQVSPFNRRISKFMITSLFDDKYEQSQIIYVLNQLCDSNILSFSQGNNYIRFSHDRIEEHLLTEFLNTVNTNCDILDNAIKISSQDEIVYSAMQNYFNCCIIDKQYHVILSKIDYWYGINSDSLPSLFAGCVGSLGKDALIELFYFFKLNNIDINRVLNILVTGMKENISGVMAYNPDIFFENYDLLTKLFPDCELYAQDLFYTASRYYYLQKNDLELSNRYCDMASKRIIHTTPKLTHVIRLQKAILLKTCGEIDQAIGIFDELFSNFTKLNEWENAAECILEWGGALREKTQFEAALSVYHKMKPENLNDYPDLHAKINRRIGTVYKNQMQQILKDVTIAFDLSKEELSKAKALYHKANKKFEEAFKSLSKTRNIIEKLKVLSEETESALRIAPFFPEQRYKAEYSHAEEAKLLAIAPVPDKKCLYLRECAIFNELDKNYEQSLNNLIEARNIANSKKLFYREFEANYQIAHLVEYHWDLFSQESRLLGIDAVNRALEFKLEEDNIYMMNCKMVKSKLRLKINADKGST